MNSRTNKLRSALATLPLVLIGAACSSSSDGGGDANNGLAPAAQNSPVGTWIVDINESGCFSDSNRDVVAITISGNTVTIRSLFEFGNLVNTGTLNGRSLPSTTGPIAGIPPLEFNEGFTSFTGTRSVPGSAVDENFNPIECEITTSVSGTRIACGAFQTGTYTARFLTDGGAVIREVTEDLDTPDGGCTLEGSSLFGFVNNRQFNGDADISVTAAEVGLDASLFQDGTLEFLVNLGADGETVRGTWTAFFFDPVTDQDVTATGPFELVPPAVQADPDCTELQEGIWDFQFGDCCGIMGNLTQEGCFITIESTPGDRFTGTLDGNTLTVVGAGFFEGDNFTGQFNGNNFTGTAFAAGENRTATGTLSDPVTPTEPSGGDCPDVASGPWTNFTLTGDGTTEIDGGSFTLDSNCNLIYFVTGAADGSSATVNIQGPLSSTGVWDATGTITASSPDISFVQSVSLNATFSGDPATTFSGTGSTSTTVLGQTLNESVTVSGSRN